VRIQAFDHAETLRPVGIQQSITDDDEPAGLQGVENRPIDLALLGTHFDVVKCERGDDRVASREIVLEAPAA
jgi:hypothetical protein